MDNHRTWIEISGGAIKNNIEQLSSILNPETEFVTVIKANAYGHGLSEIVSILKETSIQRVAVDNLDEALLVRELWPQVKILLIGSVLSSQLEKAIRAQIEITVFQKEIIPLIEEIAQKYNEVVSIHLKIDTGMGRLGILPKNLSDILMVLSGSQFIDLLGVSTHFSDLDNYIDPSYTQLQCNIFEKAIEQVFLAGFKPQFLHGAKSSAVILYPDTQGGMVRVGLTIYGVWPTLNIKDEARRQKIKCDLKLALTWKAKVVSIKSLPVGSPIGYGLTETLKKNSRIAVLPIGYYDGFDRKLSGIGEVLIKGYRCKVLGLVCMNMIIIDVSGVPNIQLEEVAIIIGSSGHHQITVQEIAKKIGTTPYEILSRINPLIPRFRID